MTPVNHESPTTMNPDDHKPLTTMNHCRAQTSDDHYPDDHQDPPRGLQALRASFFDSCEKSRGGLTLDVHRLLTIINIHQPVNFDDHERLMIITPCRP